MDRDRQTDTIMKYQPCGKWSQGRRLRRLLDWGRTWSRGLKPYKLFDDDLDDDILPDDDPIEIETCWSVLF